MGRGGNARAVQNVRMLMVMVSWATLPLAGAFSAPAPAGVNPAAIPPGVRAADEAWPLFRGDSHLSGIAASALPAELELALDDLDRGSGVGELGSGRQACGTAADDEHVYE